MNEITAMLLGLVPALMIILGALILRRNEPEERAAHDTLLMFEISTLVILVLLSTLELLPAEIHQRFFWISKFFFPSIFGLVILVAVNLPHIRLFNRKEKFILIVLALAIAAILAYYLNAPYIFQQIFPSAAIVLIAAWLITRRPAGWIWIPTLVVCASWAWVNGPAAGRIDNLSPALRTILGSAWMTLPALTVALMAVLVASGVDLALSTPLTPGIKNYRMARMDGCLRLLAALGLLILIVYSTAWAAIWDQTNDGLGGVFISMYGTVAAIACGMVIELRSPGRRRLVGAAFLIIVSVLVNVAFTYGWQVKFPELTQRRAARVVAAVERFQVRESRYPAVLNELVPRDLLFVPQPVMFRGESWCYQGTADAYRLAAFYHQYFGTAVSLNLYASAGNLENQPLPCAERLADMVARYDWTHFPSSDSTTD